MLPLLGGGLAITDPISRDRLEEICTYDYDLAAKRSAEKGGRKSAEKGAEKGDGTRSFEWSDFAVD